MSEQAIRRARIVSGALDPVMANQAVSLIRFEDAEGGVVDLATAAEIPAPPTADGTYNLRVVVAAGAATYSWAVEA